ncbi:MAG: periplasmic heavy metal sensor [Labilithrix sp.]
MAHCGGFGIAAGIIGAVMVWKLVRALFWRRRMMHYGHGGDCGRRGHLRGGWGGPPWMRGPGSSFWLRAIFSKLDTTPGQEREIRSAIEDFQREARAAKDGLTGAREKLAQAFGASDLDEAALVEARASAEDVTDKVKDAFAGALRRIHAVLDPKQRERLAELIAKGPRFRSWGGPYRDASA